MKKVTREKFIKDYVEWLSFRMGEVLPPEASPYRMMEIVRRQHHLGVKDLVSSLEKFEFSSRDKGYRPWD